MCEKKTGYPSVDKPWMKYYREKPIREIPNVQNLYDFVFESNIEDMNLPAIEYNNQNITFSQLKKLTDSFAGGLKEIGVKQGDIVLVGLVNSPEVVLSMLAINRIGAISKWFDIRAGVKDIENYAKDSRYMIVWDGILSKINEIRNNLSMDRIIIADLSAISFITIELDSLKDTPNYDFNANHTQISFNELLFSGGNVQLPFISKDKESPAIMVLSSGTTGTPKTIVHSVKSILEDARKTNYSDLPLEKGSRTLAILPPCLAYDLGTSILHPLSLGHTIILSPSFSPDVLMNFVGDFDISIAIPLHYRYLAAHYNELSETQKTKLKQVKIGISGGDDFPKNEHIDIERILGIRILCGYGSNETWAKLCLNPANSPKHGTVGIPYFGETVIAYDNDKDEEVRYGEVGEICTCCNTLFLYYESNKEETNKVKRIHKDGKTWFHTGDYGFIDEDGYITLMGRLGRVIVRKAFKISAKTIEDSITNHPWVDECIAVQVPDKEDGHVPMAFVIVNENAKAIKESEIRNSILDKCKLELKEYEIPKYFEFLANLPYTQNGKHDYKKLEELGSSIVDNIS